MREDDDRHEQVREDDNGHKRVREDDDRRERVRAWQQQAAGNEREQEQAGKQWTSTNNAPKHEDGEGEGSMSTRGARRVSRQGGEYKDGKASTSTMQTRRVRPQEVNTTTGR